MELSIKPRIELICIGTELLTGKINSHTAYIGPQLESIGFSLTREHTVSDDPKIMKETFHEAWKRSDIVINAGGLGPTFDDITRDVWSKVVKSPLKMHESIVKGIRAKFKSRGIEMPPQNMRQGYVLKGAQVIPNHYGTAPGQLFKKGKKMLILLPGPARELYPMMEKTIIPRLQTHFSKMHSIQKSFHLVGVPESVIDEEIRPLVRQHANVFGNNVTHGILASNSIITVKFRVEGKSRIKLKVAAQYLANKFRQKLKAHMFGENNETLPMVVGKLLKKKKKTLAVGESCTGGLISKMITDQPGTSDFFKEGITTYSNQSKIRQLNVKESTLKKYGAVSNEVASEMAQGLRKTRRADYAISVTGIAGPSGGTKKKPVGLVYIGCAGPHGVRVKEFHFKGDREWIRHRTSIMALEMLRRHVTR